MQSGTSPNTTNDNEVVRQAAAIARRFVGQITISSEAVAEKIASAIEAELLTEANKFRLRMPGCGDTNCQNDREKKMRPLSDGGCCDPCIESIVHALQSSGIKTRASCCGHGFRPGCIALADGREIHIARDFEESRLIDQLFTTDINGIDEHQALISGYKRMQSALEKIACLTQSTDLLWWQVDARKALGVDT
ncbi:hypothetical protein [Roseibium sp. Sym1]|uniref:hypothetical protein n=1 Tax=Roseibium sp. Sym1 TaxID=3016006 RepID=UPI0022B44365|nr:hypothetical protein [Roseibium sp. Sym1]